MHTETIVAGLIILIIIWAFIERKLLITTKYEVVSDTLPKEFDGTNFVVLSDLHNQNFGKDNERLIHKIDLLSPDFILVAGDMINKDTVCYPSTSFTLLEALSEKYKIYYGYGNHELKNDMFLKIKGNNQENKGSMSEEAYSTWVEYKENLIKSNVTILNNESITIDKGEAKLTITGLSIGGMYFRHFKLPTMTTQYLNQVIGEHCANYQILIAHNPCYYNDYLNWGADLVLSGHLHGGLVRLPFIGGLVSPQVIFFPKYTSGLYRKKEESGKNQKAMIVSRGLGSHSIMPRLFNIPDLVFVRLKNP
ncbi:MAG: metallophosphoesterase [Mobilitalea sp.]